MQWIMVKDQGSLWYSNSRLPSCNNFKLHAVKSKSFKEAKGQKLN